MGGESFMDNSKKIDDITQEEKWKEKIKELQDEKHTREIHKNQVQINVTEEEGSIDAATMDIEAIIEENNRLEKIKLGNRVNIAKDNMSAEIILAPKEDGKCYSQDEIKDILMVAGVKQGILTDEINKICEEELYFQPFEVAKGKEVQKGKDGFFSYFFDTKINKQPKIREDGSVDYHSIDMFVTVQKGELIASYTPPVAGGFGYTVTGQLLTPPKSKNLPRHKGRGFYTNEEQTEYRASFSGKVELKGQELEVSRIFRHKGNVDITVGNIEFDGDITIDGDVTAGMKISASGNIEIGGHVGATTIIAGKDVLLKSGMQGEQIGSIIAGGDVSGKYFEGVSIRSKGTIKANYLFMCKCESEKSILILGNKGAIVGGETMALYNIEAKYIGNEAFISTSIKIGFTEKYIEKYDKLNKKIEKLRSETDIFENAIKKFTSNVSKNYMIDEEMFAKIRQAYDIKKSETEEQIAIRHELLELLSTVKGNKIKVLDKVYEGVIVQIDTSIYRVEDNLSRGEFIREKGSIKYRK